MGGECSECRKWEEEIYWTHFQAVQFFQFLSGRFDQQLAIPKKFSSNLREKLAESVALKGPSGATWTVGLTTSGDTLLLKEGWKKFVEDHSLEEDDVLIFRYNGNSLFDVLMFDHRSLCEKEASYFVKKCGHLELESGCPTKKGPGTFEVMDDSSQDAVGSTPSKKLKKHDTWTSLPVAKRPEANARTRREAINAEKISGSTAWAYPIQYVSKRRSVTEEEKERALQTAHAASTQASFLIVMRPSHVYKGFYLSIPAEWASAHLSRKRHDVILHVGENTWVTKYVKRSSGGGGLASGWKKFAVENFLEESDVCLFELATGTNDALNLDARIFRVVEEVIPPARVTSYPSKGKMSSKYPGRK
ncbi:hypothetical protein RJ639_006290 [Escallonia herrerae]|uniref:TF-B3 domain-containing protein n=1 Tax=Escallonia herrerae TaxID=1293975 RepID=A0AA88W0R2_9ASTE|nr:hypothetical protein RJ639_006290 [Escallonia herrerae]